MPQDHESIKESDFSSPDTSELETARELSRLPETLGFVESSELAELRIQLTEALIFDAERAGELANEYRTAAEQVVNQADGSNYARGQIGLTIRMALIWRDGGQTSRYLEDLQDAATYAWNMREDDVVVVLDASLRADRPKEGSEVGKVTEPTGEQLARACSEVLSPEDCEELAGMSIDDGAGYAFTLLLENGVEDPELFLREKGILE